MYCTHRAALLGLLRSYRKRHCENPASTIQVILRETVIGGRIRVPEGVSVVTPVHAVMWNEENYERPKEFIPETYHMWLSMESIFASIHCRFLGNNGKAVSSATFLPFGIGPRNCAGARFAEMEFKTVIASIIRRFELALDPAHVSFQRFLKIFLVI